MEDERGAGTAGQSKEDGAGKREKKEKLDAMALGRGEKIRQGCHSKRNGVH